MMDFADLVDEAVERSGGETSTAQDVVKVRRGFRLLTERWTAMGYNTWRLEVLTRTINGTTNEVSLTECVDDVIQINAIRRGGSETTLRRISPIQYAQLTAKDTQGQPAQYYLDRKECPKLFIFPIGTPTTPDTLTIYYVHRPEEFDQYEGDASDVPSRWLDALVSGLALDLARKRPGAGGQYNEALIQRLKMEAMEAEDIAQRADRGRERYRYRNSYGR